ncbi:MAG: Hsp20/alpha crystallin family protein [Acidobacteriia bacterium]|nr:Hsp20/alpha crystallin family protein [Terriglobia bacterium]
MKGAANGGLGGILQGFTSLLEKLEDLAEKGQELKESGEFTAGGKERKGIYGFTVKVGIGGEHPRVESFGNIRQDTRSGRTVVEEVREPVVDIFEEQDHVLLVAEMPGVALQDIKLDVKDDLLTIAAEHGDTKYRKEVQLPGTYARDKMKLSCNNGVLEVKCFL